MARRYTLVMEIESVLLEEPQKRILHPHNKDELNCIFYKKEACNPNKMKFKICGRCHRSRVITMENLVPRFFERIIGIAIMIMGMTFGTSGQGGSATGTGSGGSGGSSGGGGAGSGH